MAGLQVVAGGRAGFGRRGRASVGIGVATPGDPEFAVIVLVLVELAALVALRRKFKTAHGG